MARVHQFDPRGDGRCVNSSITRASPADAQQTSERLIHLSLQTWQHRSTESAPKLVHSREQESRSSQESPPIHGL